MNSSKTKMRPLVVITCALALTASLANAEAASNRSVKQLGIHAGLIGDPFPTLVGINVNYNLVDFMRLTAGYGSITATSTGISGGPVNSELTATTIGAGARFMVPDWSFTPVAGLSFANVTVTASGFGNEKIGGFSGSGSHFYVTGGIDWQAGNGFNLGVGYNYSLLSGVGGLPYVNLGMYF